MCGADALVRRELLNGRLRNVVALFAALGDGIRHAVHDVARGARGDAGADVGGVALRTRRVNRDPGEQQRQGQRRPILHRQRRDLFLRHDGGHFGLRRLDNRRFAGDGHRFLQRRETELEVTRVFLADDERDVLDRDGLESGKLRRQVVTTWRDTGHAILAVGFGNRRADGPALGVRHGDGDARKDAALRVRDRSGDHRACGLGVRGNGMTQLKRDDESRQLEDA